MKDSLILRYQKSLVDLSITNKKNVRILRVEVEMKFQNLFCESYLQWWEQATEQ